MTKPKPKITTPIFAHFIPEVSDKLQNAADTYMESYNDHEAFVYMVAELYETTHPDKFIFSDGPKDGGIDFFIKDENSYTIGQCKCPELESLQHETSVPKFDQAPLEELMAAINMLRDKKGDYDVKSVIKRLRGDYQRDLAADPESTNLTALLAVLGELTSPAQTTFQSYRASLAEEGIRLKLLEWKDIYQALHALESPADIDFSIPINFEDENDLLAHADYCYVLANAFDFYQAFREHEWNLFEWNVRYQLHKSPINRRIVGALLGSKGRKKFHHYNNGILITCRSYSKDMTRKRLKLNGPQIINGCQTVRSICEAYERLQPHEQTHFRDHTKVQVKILKTTEPEFIGELVISTNDQNPMNPRNLKSNSAEQRDIQKSFRELSPKWFFERKDGELLSLVTASSRVRWFRKSDYTVRPRKYRLIDNQELAKAWHAFIGYSHRALRGGINYFEDEQEGIYSRVYKSAPSPAFWSAFSEPIFDPSDQYFEPGSPSVYQYLMAYGITKFINAKRVSFRNNRTDAIKRGIIRGELQGNPETGISTNSDREIDGFLSRDVDYLLNIIINNMKELLIELFSFVLTRKYVACDAVNCQKLLTLFPREAEYFNEGFDYSAVPAEQQDGKSLFGPIYEFLKDCVKQYYFEFEAEIKAAPRLKSYLAQRETVNRLRELLLKRNKSIRGYDKPWKEIDKTLIDSLPEMPGA